jgi:pimeloyl-ACP methyl ester carboxylesterase
MAGLDPAIHVFNAARTWMPGTSPGMTETSMNRILSAVLAAALTATIPFASRAADTAPREPYGIALEGFPYPYPVQLLPVVNDGEQLSMAYMDVAPAQPNGRTVVLLHGRNFPSSYWAPVIKMLSEAGFRVVVPDQVGFGKSSKPTGELHFDTLARTPSRCLIISRSTRPRSSRIRSAACSACASPVRTRIASPISC